LKNSLATKEVALIATMAALAAVGRVPFAFIPGVQPTTFIVMMTGWVFGARIGFLTGAIAALSSNFFLGQGPWTPWQMAAWGLGGAVAGLLSKKQEAELPLVRFTLLTFLWGFLFGWIMNIWHWIGFIYPLNMKTFMATYAVSLPFDSLHACGNAIFSLTFGTTFHRILRRFRKRITVKTLAEKLF